eukprot:g23745.t1
MRFCLKKIFLTIFGATVTFLLVALVDYQMREERSGSRLKASRFSVSLSGHSSGEEPLSDRGGGAVAGYIGKPRGQVHSRFAAGPLTDREHKVELRDIFIAIKTTRKFHKTRLELLLKTWISRVWEQ